MYNYRVKQGQNLMDIALQEYGAMEGLTTILDDNKLPMAATLQAGQVLRMYEEKVLNTEVVEHLRTRNTSIVTATTPPTLGGSSRTEQFKEEHFNSEQFK